MNFCRFIILSLATLVFGPTIQAAEVLELTPGQSFGDMGIYSAWAIDPNLPESVSAQARIEALEQNPEAFTAATTNLLNPGLRDSIVWARVTVGNLAHEPGQWVLSLNRFALPVCEIYLIPEGGNSMITLFDGTGVGLQDLAVAASVVDLAVEKGIAIEVDF